MAGNDFMTFLDVVGKDTALQAELSKTVSAEDFAAASVRLGSGHGFRFSTDDVLKTLSAEASQQAQSDALSDEQLDAVAGGICSGVSCVVTRDSLAQTLQCNNNLKLNWVIKV
ncbi:MAG: Nif11-like leader peptide family RiPP precursor [Propionivibrio sp.]|uniref:Nif11-like leader peptide family RiPP n=1 Tax=Candidatus Propionivibrio dominans TaxID=2954373 RepID=A0A9D7IH08_9RHOO|nr:Nif11-like leader peptide family RiPP precursor [Candidatus Propionivibrio dominans]